MDSLVGNPVHIMLESIRIAQFSQQLCMYGLVGNTVQIVFNSFRIFQFAAANYG